ncbi:hypothetical protein [Halomonas cerina]|uniref:DNA-directed RNA polymerase specialized sigma24 family protein n=1 Tax=Halomonas cerina TaxID=447424 RepID=A0A839VAP4_9GAMM|nr:hypothetical protein [Halomonas cerina]MBB3191045.1 DNA-directed RNA polymerase specialized sigma24 family protein [Halomonas cerina]
MTRRIAVITGDVIDSRHIHDTRRLSRVLDDTMALLRTRFAGRTQRYRGDGFQAALPGAAEAISVAVLLRAALIRHSTRDQRWDARLAIAIGNDDEWERSPPLGEASGAPYVASGQALDALDDDKHLCLMLEGAAGDGCLELLLRFVDERLDDWSAASAEAVYHQLCQAESQQALAVRLGISQPAVHKRLHNARWPLLKATLEFLERRIKEEGQVP